MMASVQHLIQHAKHAAFGILAASLVLALGAVPAQAQDNGGSSGASKQKLENLKKQYAAFQQAAKKNNHETAYTHLAQATQLAEETEQSGALSQLRSFQQKLPTKWGNKSLKEKNYEMALTHFKRGMEWSPNDAYVYYGKGLALVNMDSTESALEAMQQAIKVGQENGDTRTANLAADRIRQEFVARASKALSASNPTRSNANTALEALDQMREYVDPNAKSLFYRATALYTKGEYENAIQTAREGLDLHQGSRSDAAKYYFVIGESQLDMGDKASACETFKQSNYGDYSARSDHYLKNECQ